MIIYAENDLFIKEADLPRPPRHGLWWTSEEVSTLDTLFKGGYGVTHLAKCLGRSSLNVCLKLETRGLLTQDRTIRTFYKKEESLFNTYSEITKVLTKETMKTLQQQTLIFGQDVSSLNSSSIIDLISKCQEKRRKYQALEITSTFVQKEMEEIDQAVAILIAKLDAA